MLHISKNPRDGRLLIWILLLISIFGPWVFDTIYMPSENPCSIRLRENFCGEPMIGVGVISAAIGVISNSVLELAKGAAVTPHLVRYFFIGCLLLPIVLPFFSTLLMIVYGDLRPRLAFHVIACSAAVIVGLMVGISGYYNRFWLLWGIWLYVGSLTIALILEIVVLVGKRRLPPPHIPNFG